MLHDKNHILKQLSVIYLSALKIFEGKALGSCYVKEYYVIKNPFDSFHWVFFIQYR